MINLHESMGPDRDRTRDPWICSQIRIRSQTRYRLRYAARLASWKPADLGLYFSQNRIMDIYRLRFNLFVPFLLTHLLAIYSEGIHSGYMCNSKVVLHIQVYVISIIILSIHMGLDARKAVFGGLLTTKAQTSLHIRQSDQPLCYSRFGKYHI